MDQTLEFFQDLISQREPNLIMTLDATALVLAQELPGFADIIRRATLRTADGAGVKWALRRKGHTVTRVSGVDLVERMTELSAQRGYRLYFIGAEPGVTDLAAERLRLKYPGCNIVGTHHGYFPADSDPVVAADIAKLKPDVVFAAMGMPRQEQFILNTMQAIGAPIMMGVGGSFDVFSGKTKRAPKLMQALHLEWLWRLMLNPTKIAKVKKLPKFALMVLREGR